MGEVDQRGIDPECLHMEASRLLEAVGRLLNVMETLRKVVISRVVYFETHPGIYRKTLVRRCLEVCIDAGGFSFRGSLAEVCGNVQRHMETLAGEHKRLRDITMLHGKSPTQ